MGEFMFTIFLVDLFVSIYSQEQAYETSNGMFDIVLHC